jgi:hypothetical protein
VPANALSLSTPNPILIYSFLALYGVITIVILTYVRKRFRLATDTLKLLKTEWDTAESRHAGFVGIAQQQISKLAVPAPAPPVAPQSARHSAVGFDTRNQVVAMAKRGIGITDIARACALHEGEVEVLLGMARLSKNTQS